MKLKFYVLNRDSSLFTCFVIRTDLGVNTYLLGYKTSKQLETSRIFCLNPYSFHMFLNELNNCPTYHRAVAINIKRSSDPYVIQLVQCKSEFIDKTWGEIIRLLIWEQLEIDHMMSWLSTLGGAFSALGDYFETSAEIAGKISIQQMRLAFRLGDPGLRSRCLLYFSISLIQKHEFKIAQKIIKSQYEFAKQHDDVRLIKMCLGIWSKLQWTHKISRQSKKAQVIK
ncbi:CLUMA_CG001431, isoform A [Clunio marinus]|uniref:CLUMA_CG001431, isoform A n=1 Tax=Clunio marinus TaxID=568069 RepID=A0A1J1HIA6_9DIPT|nr:CLUMA_CG001431, isoform A [Clunio marinus]